MSYETISVEARGRVTIITINRPEAHNALNKKANEELTAAFDDFAANDEQWVAIITGSGPKAFCTGLDLKQQAAGGDLETPHGGFGGLCSRTESNKPVIAAVNGVAMGGGFEIVLACDMVIAASNAAFALPEPKVGLAALAGGIFRLPQVIGMTRAMGLLLTGRRVSAAEALQLGLVNEVVEGDVVAAAMRWADEIAACSPMSVRATKEAVRLGAQLSIGDAIRDQWEWPAMKAMLESEDAGEGPRAFAEKRTPVWQNR